jgi:hypothetical protein
MWERFMTKPFVDEGELRALGHLYSPWHCFGLVARRSWLREGSNRELLHEILDRVLLNASAFLEERETSVQDINAHFDINLEDAVAWIDRVRFAAPGSALCSPAPMLRLVIQVLVAAGLVEDKSSHPGASSGGGGVCGYSLELQLCDECCTLVDGQEPAAAAAHPPALGGIDAWWSTLVPSSASRNHVERQVEPPTVSGPSSVNGSVVGSTPGGATTPPATRVSASGAFSADVFTSRLRGSGLSQLGIVQKILDGKLSGGSGGGGGGGADPTPSGGGLDTAGGASPGSSQQQQQQQQQGVVVVDLDEGLGRGGAQLNAHRLIPKRVNLAPEESLREEGLRWALKEEKGRALSVYLAHLELFGGAPVVVQATSGASAAPRRSSVRARVRGGGGGGGGSSGEEGAGGEAGGEPEAVKFLEVQALLGRARQGGGGVLRGRGRQGARR